MAKPQNEEQRFAEDLDRVLAGAGLEPEKDAELGFAWRMMTLRASPSDNFKTALRERLLLEMVRREVAETRRASWWGRLGAAVAQDALARAAGVVAIVALVMLVFGGMWELGVFGGSEGTIVTQPPPTGAIVGSTSPTERTITVNQSVTANGFAVYLSQIVVGASAAEVYAVTPAGLATGPTPPAAEAEYRFDGATPVAAGPSTAERSAIGSTTHIWTIAGPPDGARELAFSITRVGDTPGPWTFVIPLGR